MTIQEEIAALEEKIAAYEVEHGEIADSDTVQTILEGIMDEIENREWWGKWDWGKIQSREGLFTGMVDTGSTLTTMAGLSRGAFSWEKASWWRPTVPEEPGYYFHWGPEGREWRFVMWLLDGDTWCVMGSDWIGEGGVPTDGLWCKVELPSPPPLFSDGYPK